MDMEVFGVDDLLDLSNDEFFTSSTSSTSTTTTTTATITTTDSDHQHHQFSYTDNTTTAANATYFDHTPHNYNNYSPTNFTDHLCVPNDDIAELEWLSNFVDDSFSEFPAYSIIGTMNVRSETTFNSRSRSKRSQSTTWTENNKTNRSDDSDKDLQTSINRRKRTTSSTEILPRKCTHCSSEKTPQWRTGPLGPKTLCNACGVRYKSGRLVPEYRPAASPTFVLTQHSNSHRKVLELRRQKELCTSQQELH